jgi:hypothetical protein
MRTSRFRAMGTTARNCRLGQLWARVYQKGPYPDTEYLGRNRERIYTAPGVNAYIVNASSIDKQLTLTTGTHDTGTQAWDNCGRVYRAPATITVR